MPKTADYLYAFRGTFDREPHGVCWVRMFEAVGQIPVIVMGELPQNTSTSVTNGDPHCEHLPEHEVAQLLGWEEMQALPPSLPTTADQA